MTTPNDKRSSIALELSKLKESIMRVAKERDRLPQPLFWSLFNSRIYEVRKIKQQMRAIDEVFNDTSE